MSVVIYSAFDALMSAYRLFSETYREEIQMAVGASIWAGIIFNIYLYMDSRHKAELEHSNTLAALEREIGTLSDDIEVFRGSSALDIAEVKSAVIYTIQQDYVKAEKARQDFRKEIQETLNLEKAQLEVQKSELAALRTQLEQQNSLLQGDINRILAWLGSVPYLVNAGTDSTRMFNRTIGSVIPSSLTGATLHAAWRRQDISETSMRRTIDTAFPVLPEMQKRS